MPAELETRYDPTKIEAKWYSAWESNGVFTPVYKKSDLPAPASKKSAKKTPAKVAKKSAKKSAKKKQATSGAASVGAQPYCIVIPPPNITGQLHVGHALDHTIQDVLIRAARKRGRITLWLPGTDHAGIATQARVEKNLKEEGLTRHDLGREKFVERVWEWKEHSSGTIQQQMRKLGDSVDWTRERFTMDEGLSDAVRQVFVRLYREGLIYRDRRMVNWDPQTHTVLSDLEVSREENYKGELWSFAYKLSDGEQAKSQEGAATDEIVVATTRPETMLGDTAVAVHPDDPRYQHLIGKTVRHPLLERAIPIIADRVLVDPEFGTGAVKVTPAHDPNDFEVGQRHNLEFINIFDESARINQNGGPYQGQDRFEARKNIKARLEELGLARGGREHLMAIGRSERSGVIVEPIASTQWFVKVGPLAAEAIRAVEKGEIQFFPRSWENLYFHWMREIRDWCISRQLWWGHQIPAWYGPDDFLFVECSEEDARNAAREHYGKAVELRRDPDVLDTWFSSGLWPFTTLGWPAETDDLRMFYPTSVLVTSHDIIFFWVARMIMFGLHIMKAPPFRHVYIHGLMRDEQGRKISKSLGNNIDPIDIINTYGADSYRFFLMATIAEGKDTRYSQKRLKGYQNFSNKVWNSARFVLMNLADDFKPKSEKLLEFELEAEDFWILSRLNATILEMEKAMDAYRFHIATDAIYTFVWGDFCDWYIELIKPRVFGKAGETSAESARQTAFFVLRELVGLLHPFMPFVTEEIYEKLQHWWKPRGLREASLVTSPWPEPVALNAKARAAARGLELVKEAISGARTIRAAVGIAPDRKVAITIRTASNDLRKILAKKELAVLRLAQAETIATLAEHKPARTETMETFSEGEVYINLEGLLDLDKEIARLKLEADELRQKIAATGKKLENRGFVDNAPADVVQKEKDRLIEMEEKLPVVAAALRRLDAGDAR